MKPIFITPQWIEERRGQRPPEYWTELETLVMERRDGGLVIDTDHPAYKAMLLKYRNVVSVERGRGAGTA